MELGTVFRDPVRCGIKFWIPDSVAFWDRTLAQIEKSYVGKRIVVGWIELSLFATISQGLVECHTDQLSLIVQFVSSWNYWTTEGECSSLSHSHGSFPASSGLLCVPLSTSLALARIRFQSGDLPNRVKNVCRDKNTKVFISLPPEKYLRNAFSTFCDVSTLNRLSVWFVLSEEPRRYHSSNQRGVWMEIVFWTDKLYFQRSKINSAFLQWTDSDWETRDFLELFHWATAIKILAFMDIEIEK